MIAAIMTVRSEDWCIAYTARAALRWADRLIVLQHCCTDQTDEILRVISKENPPNYVVRLKQEDPAWNEAIYRQELLNVGRSLGCDKFAILDSDEVVSANIDMRRLVNELNPLSMLYFPWRCCWRSMLKYRTNGKFGDAYIPFLFADGPGVSFHDNNGEQMHTRIPYGLQSRFNYPIEGGLLHLQHVVWRRVCAKQVWYRCIERLTTNRTVQEIETRYAPSTDETDATFADVPDEWWPPGKPLVNIHDEQAPWQEIEVQKLIQLHGAKTFEGLNLFGIK